MKITEEYIREQIQLLYSKDSNTGYAALKELQDAFEVFENAADGDLLSKNLGAA